MSINGIGDDKAIQNNRLSIGSTAGNMGTNSESAVLSQTNASDKVFADTLQKVYDDGDKKELKQVCQQFESIMMSMMYKQMKATITKSDFMESSQEKEIYDSMLDDELMNKVGSRGIGLADILYKQLSRQMDRIVKPSDNMESSEIPTTSGTFETSEPDGSNGANSVAGTDRSTEKTLP